MLIYDLRANGPVHCIPQTEIFGDAIDFHNDGYSMVTGHYTEDESIKVFDTRKWL